MKVLLLLVLIYCPLLSFAQDLSCQSLLQAGNKFSDLISTSDKEIKNQWIGKRVYVFKELTSKVWTVWGTDNMGKFKKLFWANSLVIKNAEFEVNETKRQLVIKRGKKMPHAGVWGELQSEDSVDLEDAIGIRYNPFEKPTEPGAFRNVDTNEEIKTAELVYFKDDGKVVGKL